MGLEKDLSSYPLEGGAVYYPGSGTDWGPFRLFCEHSQCQLIVYSDYGVNKEDAQAFVKSIPGWSVEGEIESISPENLGITCWNDCWPPDPNTKRFFGPEKAYGLKAILNSGSRSVQFYFLATESIETYRVLVTAGLKPSALILQDHGFGGNWASFGRGSPLYESATELEHFPEILLVAENTKAWNEFDQISVYEEMDGQMHNHKRALFANRRPTMASSRRDRLRRPRG